MTKKELGGRHAIARYNFLASVPAYKFAHTSEQHKVSFCSFKYPILTP